ncbi:MAG: hypothetical protein AAFY46_02675, partial [Planctomycetota bacterium]
VIASLVSGFVLVLSLERSVWILVFGKEDSLPEWLDYVTSLAFAWKLTLAAAVSFAVAVAPSESRHE